MGCHCGRQEVGRLIWGIARRRESMQASPPWLWNPGQTSPEVQNWVSVAPQKGHVSSKNLKKGGCKKQKNLKVYVITSKLIIVSTVTQLSTDVIQNFDLIANVNVTREPGLKNETKICIPQKTYKTGISTVSQQNCSAFLLQTLSQKKITNSLNSRSKKSNIIFQQIQETPLEDRV